jgi:hypothetical protein
MATLTIQHYERQRVTISSVTISSQVLHLALAAGAVMLVWASPAVAQENVCAAQDLRQACSFQCCGRRSCPPSCEVECVKLCVDACSSQTRSMDYNARKHDLQVRCGNHATRDR